MLVRLRAPFTKMPSAPRRAPRAPRAPPTITSPVATPSLNRMASHFSQRTFKDLSISPASKAAIEHEFMTEVQAQTLDSALKGENLLVQARTGTGKTLAFLLPAVETVAKSPTRGGVSVLILAPTRELAQQIEVEGRPLAAKHGMKIATAYGGKSRGPQINAINKGCDVLVATPGRLHDLLSNFDVKSKFSNLKFYILDEVDRLLDIGFQKQLDEIAKFLPNPQEKPRQTLFFSATIDDRVKQIAKVQLRGNFKFVSTVGEDEGLTHEHVEQNHIVAPFAQHLPTLLHLIKEDQATHGAKSKVMVFFTTARQVGFAATACRTLAMTVEEVHSRLGQGARNTNTERFRKAPGGVLLSSDVAARGVDFPGITLVVQVGIPSDGEQYVHRLGRTARAGAAGRGVLILDSSEVPFLQDRTMKTIALRPMAPPSPEAIQAFSLKLSDAFKSVNDADKSKAYLGWLGYYNGQRKILGWTTIKLVEKANEYSRDCLGWTDASSPEISTMAVSKMGLKGVPGINAVKMARTTSRYTRA